jgi:predicted Rossmann-fold nucleotide-binding protein
VAAQSDCHQHAALPLHELCIHIDAAGIWDGLLRFLDTAVEAGFLKAHNRALLRVAANAVEAAGVVVEGSV